MKRYQLVILSLLLLILISIASCKKQDKSNLANLGESVPPGDTGGGLGACKILNPGTEFQLIELCASFGINCTEGAGATEPGACVREPQLLCTCPNPLACRLTFNQSIRDPDTKEITENRYIGKCEGTPLPLAPYNLTVEVRRFTFQVDKEETKLAVLRWDHSERSFEKDQILFTLSASFNDSDFQGIAVLYNIKSFNRTLDKSTKYGFHVIAQNQYGKSEPSNSYSQPPENHSHSFV